MKQVKTLGQYSPVVERTAKQLLKQLEGLTRIFLTKSQGDSMSSQLA